MSTNAFTPQGPTFMVAANATAPSGVQITCCANQQSTNGLRLFNEDNANIAWYGIGATAVEAKNNALIAAAGCSNMGIPLPPLAVEVIRTNYTTPKLFVSGITRVSVAANIFVTPGEGL